ncbi:thioredoxin-like domain-containing protein [Ditylenchus destructor]|nr:thioredoxin-like domain-containing protein [Ditylenchus destructor]
MGGLSALIVTPASRRRSPARCCTSARPQRGRRRSGAVRAGLGHELAAAVARLVRRHAAAARGSVDGGGEVLLRPAAAVRGAVDRSAGVAAGDRATAVGRAADRVAALLGLFQRTETNTPRVWLRKSAAMAAMVFGVAQFVGVAAGGTDTLKPLAGVIGGGKAGASAAAAPAGEVSFRKVKSVAELDEALRSAGKPVMLDFYADWCVSCREMERFTFTDPRVQTKLAGAVLLKADVTANNAEDRELLKRFKLFGPPGTIFFDAKGRNSPRSCDRLPGRGALPAIAPGGGHLSQGERAADDLSAAAHIS